MRRFPLAHRRRGCFPDKQPWYVGTASNAWEQTKEKAGAARERTEIFVRNNPIPILLSALGIGIAIGLAIRYASSTAERRSRRKK
jgi:hypothetical protein